VDAPVPLYLVVLILAPWVGVLAVSVWFFGEMERALDFADERLHAMGKTFDRIEKIDAEFDRVLTSFTESAHKRLDNLEKLQLDILDMLDSIEESVIARLDNLEASLIDSIEWVSKRYRGLFFATPDFDPIQVDE
jgi:hypothetical protein